MIDVLDYKHVDSVKHLFYDNAKFMSSKEAFREHGNRTEEKVRKFHYDYFCDYYLNGNGDGYAIGFVQDNRVEAFMTYQADKEEPSWFLTLIRASGKGEQHLPLCLDFAVRHHESEKRLKFYSCMNARYAAKPTMRKLLFSEDVNKRYDYFDEYITKAHEKCAHPKHFKLLYQHFTYPVDTVVRCTYMKREYR